MAAISIIKKIVVVLLLVQQSVESAQRRVRGTQKRQRDEGDELLLTLKLDENAVYDRNLQEEKAKGPSTPLKKKTKCTKKSSKKKWFPKIGKKKSQKEVVDCWVDIVPDFRFSSEFVDCNGFEDEC